MITSPSTTKRLLIPRWRTFAETTAAGELSARKPTRILDVSTHSADEFLRRKENWHKNPSEVTAAELVESAIILGHEDTASGAALFLTSVQADITPMVRRQSQQLLARLNKSAEENPPLRPSIRDQLKQLPDDAILWVELSLRQTISGAADNAVRSMRTALKLAPDNRYVLRSAARLFNHLHEPDVGYYFLSRSPATEYDPWLMSAEIAIAGRVERRSLFLKKGLSILNSASHPRLDFSELAGAAATTFLDGTISKKEARRLFLQSLAEPTDNAIAQAEWASQATGERFLDADNIPRFKRANEAQALHSYGLGDYITSLRAAKGWIAEEQFSGRAYSAAAAAANTMDDYESAILICHEGIQHDPKSASLRNSLVFALASSNRLTEAEQALQGLRLAVVDPVSELVTIANQGLIAMRRADFNSGEVLYKRAISGFRVKGSEYLATCALAYFAREAKAAGHPKATEIICEAKSALDKRRHFVAERILKQIG